GPPDSGERERGDERGSVDQDAEPAEGGFRLGHGGLDGGLFGHVHPPRDGGGADLAGGLFGRADVDVGDGHTGPFGHVGPRQRQADTPRRPGDQRRLSVEPFHANLSPSLSKRWILSASGVSQTASPWCRSTSPPARTVMASPSPVPFTWKNV